MSILKIEEILNVIGPGRILYIGSQPDSVIQELLNRGVDAYTISDNSKKNAAKQNSNIKNSRMLSSRILSDGDGISMRFDSIIVDTIAFMDLQGIASLISNLYANTRRSLVIWTDGNRVNHSQLPYHGKREPLENEFIKRGFRRHPRGMSVSDYHAANDPGIPEFLFFERIPKSIVKKWTLADLIKSRDLHMDMLRESSPRADAHIIRYVLAAEWVRAGDTVLDCACGLGYGTYTLAACSRGSQFIGIDIDEGSIDYARDQFCHDAPVRFECTSADSLKFIPDSSIDIVVSFETIEHLEDYHLFLEETERVLKPDGRFIASVPNLWVNAEGEDPNPYHHHVFDYDKLHDLVSHYFIPEASYTQDAPGGFKHWQASRSLIERPLDSTIPDSEWLIIVASNNPQCKSNANYVHPDFSHIPGSSGYCLTDFASYYDNPWIYRPMVQIGERIRGDKLLLSLATEVQKNSKQDSPDFGAALTVKGYQALSQNKTGEFDSLLKTIDNYCDLKSENPHTIRWQISAAFLAGRISMSWGKRSRALDYFNRVIKSDVCLFSPLLMTKVVAASFWKGVILLVDDEPIQAKEAFLTGTKEARKALHFPDINAIGDPENPLIFGFSELAEVSDMAAQCATALRHLPVFKSNPGLFWEKINIKRFGLATWALNLTRENIALRRQISELARKDRYSISKLTKGKKEKTRWNASNLEDSSFIDQPHSQLQIDTHHFEAHRQLAHLFFKRGDINSFFKELAMCIKRVNSDKESDLLAEDISAIFPEIRKDDFSDAIKNSQILHALMEKPDVARRSFLKCLRNLLSILSREHSDEERNNMLYSVDFLALAQTDIHSLLQLTIETETDSQFKKFLVSYLNSLDVNGICQRNVTNAK